MGVLSPVSWSHKVMRSYSAQNEISLHSETNIVLMLDLH